MFQGQARLPKALPMPHTKCWMVWCCCQHHEIFSERRSLCSSPGCDIPGFSILEAEFVSADFSNKCYHTHMPLLCQSILHHRKPFAGLFLPLLHYTQNFQRCHFGKLIQDIDLFQTTGKSSLLPLFFFCIKPCSTYVLLVPVQKQRWTQRATLPSDLHDEGIPCIFKMR